jgi:hypothetical protein
MTSPCPRERDGGTRDRLHLQDVETRDDEGDPDHEVDDSPDQADGRTPPGAGARSTPLRRPVQANPDQKIADHLSKDSHNHPAQSDTDGRGVLSAPDATIYTAGRGDFEGAGRVHGARAGRPPWRKLLLPQSGVYRTLVLLGPWQAVSELT